MDELLTLAEAARYLRVHERTVRRWVSEGRLPVVKIARTVRVQRHTLEEMTQPENRKDSVRAIDRIIERRQRLGCGRPTTGELFAESRKMLESQCPNAQ